MGIWLSTETISPSGDPLIASDEVVGTKVRRPTGETLGEIVHIVIAKRSGRVAHVVMRFGGFFGIGATHCALPWQALKYEPSLDAYELDISEAQLRSSAKAFKARGG